MAGLEADLLLDRRRLKRRLVFWRVLAVLAVIAALATAVGVRGTAVAGKHITRVRIAGVIGDEQKLIEAVDALADDSGVAAVILAVNSPGGSVSGGEGLHDAVARVAAKKPVVAVMGGTAASAAYMLSLPASRIFAHDSTLTGSIGVILETGNAGGLLDKLGLQATPIVSGPLKGQPSFTEPMSPAGRAYLQDLVDNLFGQFVAMVAQARHMDEAAVRKLADGRAYTGQQALPLGLIDAIGGEPEARAWLAAEKGVSAGLPVDDLKLGGLWERTFGAVLHIAAARLGLDLPMGEPLAVWSPGLIR